MGVILDFNNDAEVKKEAAYYMLTGGIVHDPFWSALEMRRNIDPARFDANHPNIAGFFKRPECLNQLPAGPVFNNLEQRFDLNPTRFTDNHPFWGKLIAQEVICPPPSTTIPPPPPIPPPGGPPPGGGGIVCPPPGGPPGGGVAVPEPGSAILMGITMIWVALIVFVRRMI